VIAGGLQDDNITAETRSAQRKEYKKISPQMRKGAKAQRAQRNKL
jgi:hypothetical protein